MMENICLDLMRSVLDSQKDLIAIFKGEELVLTNKSFNTFFGTASLEEYKNNFGPFIDHFVPHPSYFNREKIAEGQTWFESIMELEEIDRVVSMLSQNYDPHAFSVQIDAMVEDYRVIVFMDITQSLIKRIMIENNASLDAKSGAYSKNYFLQVMKSYEEASIFNEKIIGVSAIDINSEENVDDDTIREFVQNLKATVRQDDMLVRWNSKKFLLAYLIDDENRATQVVEKLKHMTHQKSEKGLSYEFSSVLQNEKESISSLIDKLNI